MIDISKPLYYLEREGWRPFVDKAIDKMLAPIFVHKKMFIYRSATNKPISIGSHPEAIFNELFINDLARLEKVMYQSREVIEKWFHKGDRCFTAEINGRIVHYTWVCFGEEYLPSIEKNVRVKENEAYVYNVRTLSGFRGQGIFPFVLDRLCKQLKIEGYEKILASIQSNNIPSQKAFEKAGFKKSKEISYFKIFGYKRYHYKELS